jgi:hypothetical protein
MNDCDIGIQAFKTLTVCWYNEYLKKKKAELVMLNLVVKLHPQQVLGLNLQHNYFQIICIKKTKYCQQCSGSFPGIDRFGSDLYWSLTRLQKGLVKILLAIKCSLRKNITGSYSICDCINRYRKSLNVF